MITDDFFRVTYLVAIAILPLCFKRVRKDRISKFIILFIGFSILGEATPLFYPGYNLLHLSMLATCQLGVVSTAIYYETSKLRVPLVVTIGGVLFFTYLYISSWSSYSFITAGIAPFGNYPIGLHQFFDLQSVINIGLIVLMFHWLTHLVNLEHYKIEELRKRYFFIFGFLIYAGGTFFMVAFGRIIIPSLEEWFSLWSIIFYPIWIIFYLLLFTGIIWKPIRS